MRKKKPDFPRCEQIGATIILEPISHIPRANLRECLNRAGIDEEIYADLYGIQTQCAYGPYPWDVEAVLERMMSGKLTGTQLLVD
jgi:hypothetical protein